MTAPIESVTSIPKLHSEWLHSANPSTPLGYYLKWRLTQGSKPDRNGRLGLARALREHNPNLGIKSSASWARRLCRLQAAKDNRRVWANLCLAVTAWS